MDPDSTAVSPELVEKCVPTLLAMRRREDGLFAFRTWLRDGHLVNDFDHPHTVRYTINTLLGLNRAVRAGVAGIEGIDEMTSTFQRRFGGRLEEPADEGLNLLLLVEREGRSTASQQALERVGRLIDAPLRRINMQDLGWLIWGCAAAQLAGLPGAQTHAARFFATMRQHFVSDFGLPRHSVRRYRRNVVSFGSLVYFLRACWEYAQAFGDEAAAALFHGGVRLALSVQGPDGEWPWLLDSRSGIVLDPYPVFSVHQDSMAPLFLLPALDAGEEGAADAIERGVAWNHGQNELGRTMYVEEPFFAFRAIERTESAPRIRRYLRTLPAQGEASAAASGRTRVRVNPECRSYHLGWILYAWAERTHALSVEGPAFFNAT